MSNHQLPLNALRAFVVAGKHLNFSLAADELNVTQGAVSRQVRLLEEYLGELLFHRGARGVELTEQGSRYLKVATDCFDMLHQGLSRTAVNKRQLALSILPSTASLWLQQRLSAFEIEHPELCLTVSTSQRPANFDSDGVDLALRIGIMRPDSPDAPPMNGDLDMVASWTGVEAVHLWDEQVIPVCSKGYIESVGGLNTIEDLSKATLIHNESRPTLWQNWLEFKGYAMPEGAQHWGCGQRYMAALVAREGRGVACLPTKDLQLIPWRDELVCPFDGAYKTGYGYYFLYRRNNVRMREIEMMIDWIKSVIN